MKRSELANICNDIVEMHVADLGEELPDIIRAATDDSKSLTDNTASIIANVAANSIKHSVQIVSDVLANLDLIELEDG